MRRHGHPVPFRRPSPHRLQPLRVGGTRPQGRRPRLLDAHAPRSLRRLVRPAIALQCAADATSTLRLGALVWCNDYRHPVVFAQEMATLDLLSEGRLELGIGAGWMQTDYDAAGHDLRPPRRADRSHGRVDRGAAAACSLPDRSRSAVSTTRSPTSTCIPKPVQSTVPFLIGGGGPRMLRLAGEHAQIVGVNPNLHSGKIDANTIEDAVAERYAGKGRRG